MRVSSPLVTVSAPGLARAATGHQDPSLGDPALHELLANALGAPEREGVVVLVGSDAIRVADDDDFRSGPAGDLGEDLGDNLLGLRRELVGVEEEIEIERDRPSGLGLQRGPEGFPDLVLRRLFAGDAAGSRHARRGVGLIEGARRLAAGDRDRPWGRALARQEHDEVVPCGAAGQDQQRQRRETDERATELGQGGQFFAPARTRNSVPRTPRIAAGVRTFIASGDCLASLPETTASVPCLSELSNAPW